MRTDRRDELAKKIQKGSEIKPPRRCARCRSVLKHAEASDFCPECHEANRVEVAQTTLRVEVLKRDRGVCVLCNVDCLWLRSYLDELLEIGTIASIQKLEAYSRGLKGWPKAPLYDPGASLWQADHVDPTVKGGPSVLGNARTLCLGCHRDVTKGLAQERAASRRPFRERR